MERKGTFLLVVVLLVSIPCGETHIHSQKVRNYGQETVPLLVWVLALTSATLVGCCGVLPLILNRWIKLDRMNANSSSMQIVLSFAVGGLLGDVWLHLLPEAWGPDRQTNKLHQVGLWVIVGLLSFMGVEKIAKFCEDSSSKYDIKSQKYLNKDVSGYLNLLANCTDNFTHGLAIAASYIASPLVGLLTTLAIVCHEIPHEIGDFAILLRSGFSSPNAARAQLITASGGLIGVTVGLLAEQIGQCTTWMLPFTAGGFLYIALVSITPELMKEKDTTLKQILSLLFGVMIMAAVTIVERKSCNVMPETFR